MRASHIRLLILVLGVGLAAAAGAAGPTFPCRDDPRSHQFDFWIGEWNVSANGKTAGTNVITRRHQGCLIFESYTTPRGYSGQSFNFYDPAIDKWRQIWVDSGGTVIWYQGNLVDGEMRFEGELYQRNGPKALSRMTFTPKEDGSVRQLIERSTDGGTTWTVGFDGHYVKKE